MSADVYGMGEWSFTIVGVLLLALIVLMAKP
jgi:hypothetical protein